MRQKIRKGILTLSALLFPLTYYFLSPYLIVMAASQGIIGGSAILFGALLVSSVVFSRLFCGWLCPGGALQDYSSEANGCRWNGRIKNLFKYLLWAVWFGFVVFLWVQNKPLIADPLYTFEINPQYLVTYIGVATVIFLFSLLTGKRGMCHSFCWMAPFMVIGERIADFLRIPRFRLKAYPDKCISCGKCTKNCPMSLNVSGMVKSGKPDSTECVSCLAYVDGCPQKAIGCGILPKQC